MYSISNKQRDDILTLLKAFAESSNDKSLQALNRCRRAMLLVRNLEKRKPGIWAVYSGQKQLTNVWFGK